MPDTTPMMRQYARIKSDHRDALLFFRLGDFYEMFRDDAKEASHLLGLTLTSRQGVPMCGVPYHAARTYIARLLRAGRKVAICEQVKLPIGKGLADREVIEVVTPGTITEDEYLDASRNNYLVGTARIGETLSIAYLDLSTGELGISSSPAEQAVVSIRRIVARLQPRELIVQQSLLEDDRIARAIDESEALVNRYADWQFDLESAHRKIREILGVRNLKAFGVADDAASPLAAGALIDYVAETAGPVLSHVRTLSAESDDKYLGLDESTIRNLELVANLQDGSVRYTLLETIDFTRTAIGARMLRQWLLGPLRDVESILQRQTQVGMLHRNQESLGAIRGRLGSILDLERISARLAIGKAHAKDLVALSRSIAESLELREYIESSAVSDLEYCVSFGKDDVSSAETLVKLLNAALLDEPSVLLTEGRMIRRGYSEELDRLHALRDDSRSVLESYLAEEREESGISSLKVRFNRVLGHYLEVTRSNIDRVPEHFIRRQSLANAERYTTERLGQIESELNDAAERIVDLERQLFLELRSKVAENTDSLMSIASRVGTLDVLQALAHTATVRGYCKPEFVDGEVLSVVAGRHAVVEAHTPTGSFVPNGIDLDTAGSFFALITGPNMAGKSTYLRQTALIVLLAQMGSYVPADEASIGLVDRIFCRVGASDNLARGESTFLVEMNEAAFILRNCTTRSLVVMDEIGRGTSTNDGLAIAQAVIEYMVSTAKARTLFATHFHELTALDLPGMTNLSLQVSDTDGEVVFLNRVAPGPSSNAYGIHVARLAGVPDAVLQRAEQLLVEIIEAKERAAAVDGAPSTTADGSTPDGKPTTLKDARHPQGALFDPGEIILQELRSLDPDRIRPIDALERIARWIDELSSE